MNPSNAQKSEIHEATADASTSPAAEGDVILTHAVTHAKQGSHAHYEPRPLPADTHIVRDETDSGGPLVIESSDPALNPPRPSFDPFPTDGTPQIDGSVKS